MNFSVEKSCNPHKSSIKSLSKDNVFFNFDFLSALETSNCETQILAGCLIHLNIKMEALSLFTKKIIAKANSFLTMHGPMHILEWNKVLPKIVLSVPFTPVEGERILFR